MNIRVVITIITLASTITLSTICMAGDAADLVFTDGKIYTAHDKQPWAEAIAIKGNKILYVGDNAGAQKHVSSNTKQTKLNGKMVLQT